MSNMTSSDLCSSDLSHSALSDMSSSKMSSPDWSSSNLSCSDLSDLSRSNLFSPDLSYFGLPSSNLCSSADIILSRVPPPFCWQLKADFCPQYVRPHNYHDFQSRREGVIHFRYRHLSHDDVDASTIHLFNWLNLRATSTM